MKSLSRNYLFLVLGLLIFIGFELRLAFIDLPLWYDEAQSVLIANFEFPFGINNYLLNVDLQHTPFYFYLLHFWINLFGENDVTLKVLSLIFSLISIPCSYTLARNFLNEKMSLIAPLLLTFNTFNVVYSTEVRMYSLILLLTILSMNYLLKYLNSGDTKSLAKLTVVNFLMPYTFVGAFVFVLAQILSTIFIYFKSQNIKKYLISNLILFILLIPYFVIIANFSIKRSGFLLTHVSDFSLANIFGIFQNFLAPDCGTLFWATLNPFFLNMNTLIFVYIPLFTAVYLVYLATKNFDKKVLLVTSITLITLFIFVIFSINKTIVLAPRYVIFLSPLLLLLLNIGLAKIKKSLMICFIIYYSLTSMYIAITDTNIRTLKSTQLMGPIKFINSLNLSSKDMIIMPFASSVISHYLTPNSPRVPRIEGIQELRIPTNSEIYSEEIINDFKFQDSDEVFRRIILSDGYISDNFHQHILNRFVNPVEKGQYILFVVLGTDVQALIPEQTLKNMFSNENYKNQDILIGMMSKMFLDIDKIVKEEATFKDMKIVDGNVFFLYQKN